MAASRTATRDGLAFELAEHVGSLQRVLRRRTRTVLGEPALSPAEAELLRLVANRPRLRVGEAATALRLAPNTVSTLARRLVSQRLLTAERDDQDRRGVRLQTSVGVQRRLTRWRDERARLLASALEGLSQSERDALASSLPVVARLVEALEDDEPS
jgi:DNA-binding MarR family transcriptional regulator